MNKIKYMITFFMTRVLRVPCTGQLKRDTYMPNYCRRRLRPGPMRDGIAKQFELLLCGQRAGAERPDRAMQALQ